MRTAGLFDLRSNARLAYRPADPDVPPVTEASTTSSTHNSRGGGVVTPAIPRRYQAQTTKVMYAPCMPLSTGTSRPRALAAVVFATLWP